MKKMMMIAVMIGALLMPAQISAQNGREKRGDKRVQIDVKKGDNKRGDFSKNVNNGKKEFNKPVNKNRFSNKEAKHFNNKGAHHKPVVVNHCHGHQKPVVVNHCHGHQKPRVVHHHNCNDAIGAAAAVVGTIALISLLAD